MDDSSTPEMFVHDLVFGISEAMGLDTHWGQNYFGHWQGSSKREVFGFFELSVSRDVPEVYNPSSVLDYVMDETTEVRSNASHPLEALASLLTGLDYKSPRRWEVLAALSDASKEHRHKVRRISPSNLSCGNPRFGFLSIATAENIDHADLLVFHDMLEERGDEAFAFLERKTPYATNVKTSIQIQRYLEKHPLGEVTMESIRHMSGGMRFDFKCPDLQVRDDYAELR